MVSLFNGLGFLFYPRRRKKKQSLKYDETKTLTETLPNNDLKTFTTYYGHKGAQSLPFRGKWQMFLLIFFLSEIPLACC